MQEQSEKPRSQVQQAGLIIGLLLAVGLIVAPQFGYFIQSGNAALNSMAAVAILMATWWVTEAIPLPATALIPIVLFPILQILPISEATSRYAHPIIFLFLGGFLVALAIEETGLHKRIALYIVYLMGDHPHRIVFGFMLAAYSLSMWISNTAATLMLLPIASSMLLQISGSKTPSESMNRFGLCLFLGTAYAASIGGITTIIGTPPNVAFQAFWENASPENTDAVSFFRWMMLMLPLSFTFLLIAWQSLVRWIYPINTEPMLGGRKMIREEIKNLGPMQPAEIRIAVIFFLMALLWILREPIGGWGWAPMLGLGKQIIDGKTIKLVDDSTVAMAMALLCFIIPFGGGKKRSLLTWKAAQRVPWGILLLFGGGLSLAAGMTATGLDQYLGELLCEAIRPLDSVSRIAVVTAGMAFFTELTSNLASVNMILPILDESAKSLGISPLSLMLPATIAASFAFMLPAATPPNAIVYATGKVTIRQMMKAGIYFNIIGIVLAVLFCKLLGPIIMPGLID